MVDRSYQMHLQIAKKLAGFLDDKYEIFGIRFGFDPLLDIIPWAGDAITTVLGAYIVWVGVKMELPPKRIAKMIFNIVVDFVLGLIPVFGVITTVFFRSNRMNIEIIEDFLRGDRVEEGVIV